MRIKSNFKDYYDGCQQYSDDGILFIRNKVFDKNEFGTFEIDNNLIFYTDEEKYFPTPTSISMIGVGDKLYPFVITSDGGICGCNTYRWKSCKIYHGIEAIKNYTNDSRSFFAWSRRIVLRELDYVLNYINSDNATELINRFGPTFIVHNRMSVPINKNDSKQRILIKKTPKLSDFGMQKILPPMEAYIAIERYLQNKANPAKPIPEMDNNTKIELAGFNKKTSFRKTKQ